MRNDPYRIERQMYGDAVADGMIKGDIYEQITGCGEVAYDNPGAAADAIFEAIAFVGRACAFLGGQQ